MSNPAPVFQPPPFNGLAGAMAGFWRGYVIPQFGQPVYWLQRISSDMSGAAPTADWDPKRAVVMSFVDDGSWGVGWSLDGRMGYMPGVLVPCAKDDNYKQEQLTDSGLVIYQGPVVLYQQPPILRKGDILVFPDGRYVVGDAITPSQVYGQTVVSGAKMENRSTDDIVNRIPIF